MSLEPNENGGFGMLDANESSLYESVAMTSGDAAETIRELLEKLSEARDTFWVDMSCRPTGNESTVVGMHTKFMGKDLLNDPRGVWKRLMREFVIALKTMEQAGCRPDIKPDYVYTLESFLEEQEVRSV
jgi:hypothetical protein